MNRDINVCLLNDSFPPTIDGVANTVQNYAHVMHKKYGNVVVATPKYPDVQDNYSYKVIRYPSVNTVNKTIGYRTGIPLNPLVMSQFNGFKPDILHSHCPAVSTLLARQLRARFKAPIVITYHTKFDIETANIIKSPLTRAAAIRMLINNISACDEVWVVSQGSGENLRNLGYQGQYYFMENGVDFPRQKALKEEMEQTRCYHRMDGQVPIFLFVGRMRWYKGIRIILDGLARIQAQGFRFKMVFVGDGIDLDEMKKYTEKLKLQDSCVFTGAIHDRRLLQTYYSISDLFLLPSTYDTNGLVVREAAACGVASVLIRNSCAAEGVIDRRNGFLIDENSDTLAMVLSDVIKDRSIAKTMGRHAQDELYLSWDDAVSKAHARYFTVIENYNRKNLT